MSPPDSYSLSDSLTIMFGVLPWSLEIFSWSASSDVGHESNHWITFLSLPPSLFSLVPKILHPGWCKSCVGACRQSGAACQALSALNAATASAFPQCFSPFLQALLIFQLVAEQGAKRNAIPHKAGEHPYTIPVHESPAKPLRLLLD